MQQHLVRATLLVVAAAGTAIPAQAQHFALFRTSNPAAPAEHASGGEPMVIAGALAGISIGVFDILTAPSSARRHNARNPDVPKSTTTAFLLSVGGAAVPLAIAAAVEPRDHETALWIALSGGIAGPSFGHWYAGRPVRGGATAALRAAATAVALVFYACCT